MQALLHCLIVQDKVHILCELFIRPFGTMHLDTVTRFINPGCIVVAVPYIRHDDRRLSEIETFGEAVVSSMMDDGIHLRNDGRLWEPLIQNDVCWHIPVSVTVSANIDESSDWHLAKSVDQTFYRCRIAGAQ